MTPPQPSPQQQQTHQPRGFNLGGYVMIRVRSMVDALILKRKNKAV